MSETVNSSNRAAARSIGARTYMGKCCQAHPDSPRYVASKACVECAKAARKAGQQDNRERDAQRKRLARAALQTAPKRQASNAPIFDILGL